MITTLEILRKAAGLNQRMLAEKAGVSFSILSHVETRRREAYPRLRKCLAEALGVSESVLFDQMGMARVVPSESLKRLVG